jgi:hypothetical protein
MIALTATAAPLRPSSFMGQWARGTLPVCSWANLSEHHVHNRHSVHKICAATLSGVFAGSFPYFWALLSALVL